MMISIRKYVLRYFYFNDMGLDDRLNAAKAMSEFVYSGKLPTDKCAKD